MESTRSMVVEDGRLIIADEDGFTTTWPWPENKTMLGNAAFADICERKHEAHRKAAKRHHAPFPAMRMWDHRLGISAFAPVTRVVSIEDLLAFIDAHDDQGWDGHTTLANLRAALEQS